MKSGILIDKKKDFSKDKPIEKSKPPKYLYMPIGMHRAEREDLVVKIDDRVKRGSLLVKAGSGISAPLHSPVSGKIIDIKEGDSFNGTMDTLVIENDFKDEEEVLRAKEIKTIEDFTDRIFEAGIVGKGGAGFPTHAKYKEDKENIDYLVVNGAECEPYSTTDHRIMVEYAEQIIKTMDLVNGLYHTQKSYIAVEKSMTDAIDELKKAIEKSEASNIEVYQLSDRYPQGHSGLQIREVLGIEIEEGQRSGDVGVLLSNVSTYKAIYDACFENKALTSRVITVSGEKVKNPRNLDVRIGTPTSHIIEECGGLVDEDVSLINGGPMMGKAFTNIDTPVEKDTTTILCIEQRQKAEETPCIKCSRCINACPIKLNPIGISEAYRGLEYYKAVLYKSDSCISCGCCTYVCPANIDLLKDIQAINTKWEEINE